MGLFSRLGSLFKSNINDMISKAEDPEKMLNQIILDMKGQLIEAKKQVAIAIADEKRLRKQNEKEHEAAREWEKKAMMALRAGDEALAKEALVRKAEHDKLDAEYTKRPRHEYFQLKLKEAEADTGVRISLAAEVDGTPAGSSRVACTTANSASRSRWRSWTLSAPPRRSAGRRWARR